MFNRKYSVFGVASHHRLMLNLHLGRGARHDFAVKNLIALCCVCAVDLSNRRINFEFGMSVSFFLKKIKQKNFFVLPPLLSYDIRKKRRRNKFIRHGV